MKIKALIIVLIVLSACGNKEKTEEAVVEDETATEVSGESKKCYFFASTKDTVMMTLTQNANNASGELYYSIYEKDPNEGTFSGVFIGDTLYADYTFKSEGTTSVRETVFVRQGGNLFEGVGPMEEKDNKLCFVDRKSLEFGDTMILEEANCAN